MKEYTIEELLEGFQKQDISFLSRAITYLESSKKEHQKIAIELMSKLKEGSSKRIGITGTPGVGKSTFLENFGSYLLDQGKKIAVLAIDPSSYVSGGSILGDKTRMQKVSSHKNAFVRPTPSKLTLGGVASKTRETIFLCEAFGFDYIFIETVGVGQSEVTLASLVDFFILLISPYGGDELQGIKRGILEVANLVLVNKADGENESKANITKHQYEGSVHILQGIKTEPAKVLTCSSVEQKNFVEVDNVITSYFKKLDITKHREQLKSIWLEEVLVEMYRMKLKDKNLLEDGDTNNIENLFSESLK